MNTLQHIGAGLLAAWRLLLYVPFKLAMLLACACMWAAWGKEEAINLWRYSDDE